MAKIFKDDGNTLPSSAEKKLETTITYSTPNFKVGNASPLSGKDSRPASDEKMSVEKGSLPAISDTGRLKETKFG
jgi:hypothetical protein